MSYTIWWTFLKHLRDFAALQPELAGVEVRAGSKRPKDPYPCVEFLWDDENGMNLYRTLTGEFTLWVDCWVRNSGTDPSAGYEDLAALTEKVCAVLVRWSDAVMDDLETFVNLNISGIVSDGDNNRPLCGSRMVLKTEWKKVD